MLHFHHFNRMCRYILVVFNEGFMLLCSSSVMEIRFVYCHCGFHHHFSLCLPLFRYVHCSMYRTYIIFCLKMEIVDVQITVIANSHKHQKHKPNVTLNLNDINVLNRFAYFKSWPRTLFVVQPCFLSPPPYHRSLQTGFLN